MLFFSGLSIFAFASLGFLFSDDVVLLSRTDLTKEYLSAQVSNSEIRSQNDQAYKRLDFQDIPLAEALVPEKKVFSFSGTISLPMIGGIVSPEEIENAKKGIFDQSLQDKLQQRLDSEDMIGGYLEGSSVFTSQHLSEPVDEKAETRDLKVEGKFTVVDISKSRLFEYLENHSSFVPQDFISGGMRIRELSIQQKEEVLFADLTLIAIPTSDSTILIPDNQH